MGTILVTGAAGFLGSHLVERLLDEGDAVTGLDSFDDYYDPAVKRRNLAPALARGCALVEGDVRDEALVARVLEGNDFDAVAHLAARPGTRPSLAKAALYDDVNARGTLVVLDAARAAGVRRFVLASSSSVYGASKETPFREDAPCLAPVSPYAASKRAAELYAEVWARLHGMAVTVLRYFTAYGPRQRPEMAIHKFARLIETGEPLPFFGDGTSARDYTYVDDIVAGTVAALRRSGDFRTCNLGEGAMTTLAELVALLEKALGKRAKLNRLPDQPGDVSVTCADVTRAKEDLGYRPSTPLAEGLERFVEWFRKGGA